MDNSTDSEHAGKSHWGGLLVALAFGLIMYVFLLGPLARVGGSLPEPIQIGLEYLYSPLTWLNDHIPGYPISKYVQMWIK
jgi:hypothetical protein